MHPVQHLGRLEDIAQEIYFVADSENKFLADTILNVDGGFTAK